MAIRALALILLALVTVVTLMVSPWRTRMETASRDKNRHVTTNTVSTPVNPNHLLIRIVTATLVTVLNGATVATVIQGSRIHTQPHSLMVHHHTPALAVALILVQLTLAVTLALAAPRRMGSCHHQEQVATSATASLPLAASLPNPSHQGLPHRSQCQDQPLQVKIKCTKRRCGGNVAQCKWACHRLLWGHMAAPTLHVHLRCLLRRAHS